MKRLLAIILAAVLMLSLTACGAASNAIKHATSDEAAKEIKPDKFSKDFQGLQDYLLEKGYIYGKDGADNSLKSDIYYDIIGAKDGVRYTFIDGRSFVEFYDYSGELNDTAKKIIEDIKDDGKFQTVENLYNLTGVLSGSGKYVLAYNPSNANKIYEKIADEMENW